MLTFYVNKESSAKMSYNMTSPLTDGGNDDDEDDDDHVCLRCGITIRGLGQYVAHRQGGGCLKSKSRSTVKEDDEAEAEQDGHGGDAQENPSNAQPTSAVLVEAVEFFQGLQLQQRPVGDLASTSAPVAAAAADEAVFMESLGLHANAGLSPRPSSGVLSVASSLFFSPNSRLANPGPGEECCWVENIILQEIVEEVYAEQHPSTSASRNRSLLSIAKTSGPSASKESVAQQQSDFLRQVDLLNVSGVGVASGVAPAVVAVSNEGGGSFRRLWNPENEGDELWSDMFGAAATELCVDTLVDVTVAPPAQNSDGPSDVSGSARIDSGDALSCRICKRTFSTKDVLDRHLLSELHFKRAASEAEVASSAARGKKRSLLKSNQVGRDHLSEEVVRGHAVALTSPSVISCESCKATVNRWQFGKHLISHFHHHRSLLPRSDPRAQALVLRHMHDVVRLAPFQCFCGFVCNWDHEFVAHWRSPLHAEAAVEAAGTSTSTDDDLTTFALWCSFCAFRCASHEDMDAHLLSERHTEMVVAVARHVPIVIRRVVMEACPKCGIRFRLRAALRAHIRRAHQVSDYELKDHRKSSCSNCDFTSYSESSLEKHRFVAHAESRGRYSCRACLVRFDSKAAAARHRASADHKDKARAGAADAVNPARIACHLCGDMKESLAQIRSHLVDSHSSSLSQCGVCGDAFALPQDLGAHVRGRCSPRGLRLQRPDLVSCEQRDCQFQCSGMNMLLFHQALCHNDDDDEAFGCCACPKRFPTRSKLWEHVRLHGEAHRCSNCYRIFASAEALDAHRAGDCGGADASDGALMCSKDGCQYTARSRKLLRLHNRRSHFRPVACDKCGAELSTFGAYQSHSKAHSVAMADLRRYKCPEAGCAYAARKASELRSHALTHASGTPLLRCRACAFACKRASELARHVRNRHGKEAGARYACDTCEYVAKTRQHLDRHQNSAGHAAQNESFYCRLCTYSCKSLENLRKHILKTTKHVGRLVYECGFCKFGTNSNSAFLGHLSDAHAGLFKTAYDVKQFVRQYFAKRRC